ncbi:GTPase Era [Desulfolucanica intricata]|uniref:GTPase Era n=1 Tax=Desulfolucanica intricata TaxID=1285191 RepID=UPI000830F8B1|nr:GTPase Era [Desulfolucanica intricata]
MEVNKSFKSGFVAIIGRPNVGKSTLMNRMIGQKVAIMSDKPQTTRHKIHSVLTRDHAQVVFLDTPGVHKPKHKLGQHMVDTALSTLKEVDLILFMVEANTPSGAGDQYIMNELSKIATPIFLIINKVDLISKNQLLPLIAEFQTKLDFKEIIPVSALQGDNVDRLADLIIRYLPEGPKYYPDDMITDKPEQFIMAELIREKVLHLTSQEIPHSVAVVIEDIQPRPNNTVYVGSLIYVERDSQKGIIIGKKGQMLKQIGQLAREDIEKLLGSKIYLELRVKVRDDWRNKEAFLKSFGYKEV